MKIALRLLAVETATEACSVAYQNEKGEVFERFAIIPQQHTQRVFPMIREVLACAEANLSSIDAIAIGRGPGSFTGVRIAVSVAHGLGFGLNRPVYPISTLAAIAFQTREGLIAGESKVVSPVLDARMGEYYTGTYCVSWCGEAHEIVCLEEDHIVSEGEPTKALPRAKEVLLLAQMAWQKGDLGAPAEKILPVYLREKVV